METVLRQRHDGSWHRSFLPAYPRREAAHTIRFNTVVEQVCHSGRTRRIVQREKIPGTFSSEIKEATG